MTGPLAGRAGRLAPALLVASCAAAAQPPRASRRAAPGKPYASGTKRLDVDAAKVVGTIHSLLGVNRGPVTHPRRGRGRTVSHVENYRKLGIDCIRTHDFYGPTDWHVIFPRWSADPDDPNSYDFRSSDVRIRAICENGFGCFYRLGTSWRGPADSPPINDPPGTIRDAGGRIIHQADRDDSRKWGRICAQTVRHYTRGWKDGYRFPIEYWEIWNEPDLRVQFWSGTAEQYYALYAEAARAIKAVDPKLKVGGPACTGGMRPPWVEGFVRACRERKLPLDFFSWHSYGGRGEFNPYNYYKDAVRIRRALDRSGYRTAEVINTEWNAGIKFRLFSDHPHAAAYYSSTLACMLDAGVAKAFQYCGDMHPGLGLHDMRTGELKLCAYAFAAWKRLRTAPQRVAAAGSDEKGYHVVAGRDAAGRRVVILVSDFQSGHDTMHLRVANLPWKDETAFRATRRLLGGQLRLAVVEELDGKGRTFEIRRPFRSGSVCVIEIERRE